MRDIDEMNMPALGSPEAAVQAAVNLLAKVTGVNESRLAYYLDMYYQLRCRYECDKELAPLKAVFFPGSTPSAERPSPADPPDGGNPCESDAPEEMPPEATKVPAPRDTAEKRRIRERYLKARADGVTLDSIRDSAAYKITEDELMKIRESLPVSIAKYRILDDALDHLEQ